MKLICQLGAGIFVVVAFGAGIVYAVRHAAATQTALQAPAVAEREATTRRFETMRQNIAAAQLAAQRERDSAWQQRPEVKQLNRLEAEDRAALAPPK